MDHEGGRGSRNGRRRYEEEEDHHSIYIGVPVPRSYRRKRRRRRSESSRDPGDGGRDHESHRHGHHDRDDRQRYDMDDEGVDPHDQSPPLDTNCTKLEGRSVPLSPVKCGAHQNPHGTDRNMRGADCPETAFHS
ncbi:hypothetical protein AGOR_G00015650 [Albula goreensis]|uniref:Uncharacterized protein n=1 Tax=Albula goreensis TaxID=1534307 RepID=A0A8T3EA83_9TELE|nr:hypothetical protein AGOR_G00015650 [Albula goreensis]